MNKLMKTIFFLFLMTSYASCTPKELFIQRSAEALEQDSSLTDQLRKKAEESSQKTPAEKRKIMVDAINELKQNKILEKALKKGDKIPPFILPDVSKGKVNSTDLLKKGPLIITFYRGGWCPYCNLQLRDLQKHLKEIKAQGAELVAISPEKPDKTAETVKVDGVEFYVLSDSEGAVGEKFGLMFKLPKDLIKLYKSFGIDLEKSNGNQKGELPIAATYIVNQKGEIIYSFLDVDYKKRAETLELIEILKKMKTKK